MLSFKGPGPEYEEALKRFITAVIIAYEKGFTIPALCLELQMNQLQTGDQEIDRQLALSESESETRNIWMQLVYLTLEFIGYERGEKRPPKTEDPYSLNKMVVPISQAYNEGFSLEGIKLEQALRSSPSNAGVGVDEIRAPRVTPEPASAGVAAIRSQWMRLIYLSNQIAKARMQM